MTRSIEDEYNVYYPSLAAAGLALLTGLMTQSFIVGVNITDWVKGRPKTPVDQILTSIGITRICLHSFSFLHTMCLIFLKSYMFSNMEIVIDWIANSSNLSDIWLGTLFSVIFCMKICNIHNAFFLYLKSVISQRVVHLILAMVLMSMCFLSLFILTNQIITSNFQFKNFTSNETHVPEMRHIYLFIVMGNSLPLLIYCASSLLLIVSLCLHLNRMKSNSNVSTNLDSYYKAIQFMTLCLFGFMLRIGSNIAVLRLYHSLDVVWLFIIWNSVAILNSMYLIYRTKKLSNRFSRILHNGTNCMFNREGSLANRGDQEETTTTS